MLHTLSAQNLNESHKKDIQVKQEGTMLEVVFK